MSIELKDKLVTLESLGVVYNSEVNDRNAAISAEATARAEAISAETAARTEAIANEVTARNAAIVEAINQAETGAPTKVELVSQMTDPDKNYLYIGEEQGYNSGHIYYLVDGAPVDKGVFGGTNIDNTLTISGQAADAKVTGDKIEEIKEDLSALDTRIDEIEEGDLSSQKELELPLSNYETVQVGINTRNEWSPSGSSKFIPVSDFVGNQVKIEANADNGSVVCFLKSNKYTQSAIVSTYAEGTSRTFIQKEQTKTFTIPADCNYINVLDTWGANYLPKISMFVSLDDTVMTEDRIGLTVDNWQDLSCILSTYYNTSGDAQGTLSVAGATLKASGYIPLYGKMLEVPMIHVSDTTYPNFGLSLYDADFNPIYGRAISAEPNRTDVYIHWVHIYIPDNAKYFRTTYFADTASMITEGHAPTFTYNLLKDIPEAYKPITHELPVDTYMQNSIRRARQLTDIKWTPRVNIPRYSMINRSGVHFLDWFYADKEYVGIPYSGAGKGEGTGSWTAPEEWGYAHNWVGACIPFEAFVTAARYPNSIFSETVNQSTDNYDSSPFGIVCTGLVNYAVNGPLPLRGITNFFDTADNVFMKPSANNTIAVIDANDVMIGDFLYTQPHVIIITDILRDKDGNVTHVEMSEATTVGNGNNTVLGSKLGGVARRKMWKYSDFKSLYGDYVKYRRTTFYGIPYVESMYVDTGNEGDKTNIVDYPCIPYLGNGAIYRAGYIHNSKVCIGASGFNKLIVIKDGAVFNTFDIAGLTEVETGFSNVGEYEAYLAMDAEGTNKTISCHWKVVDGVS